MDIILERSVAEEKDYGILERKGVHGYGNSIYCLRCNSRLYSSNLFSNTEKGQKAHNGDIVWKNISIKDGNRI